MCQYPKLSISGRVSVNENNNDYVVYTFNEKNGDTIKTYTSKLREENGEFYFDSITDDNEWKIVREAILNQAIN